MAGRVCGNAPFMHLCEPRAQPDVEDPCLDATSKVVQTSLAAVGDHAEDGAMEGMSSNHRHKWHVFGQFSMTPK